MATIAPPPIADPKDSVAWTRWWKSVNDFATLTAGNFATLNDVTITAVANLEVASYDSGTSMWINRTLGELGIQAQGDVLDDLNTTGANPAAGDILYGTGAGALAWLADGAANTFLTTDGAGTPSWVTAGSVTNFGDLADVTITTIASGEMIQWNGSAWINQTFAELDLLTVTAANLAYQPLDAGLTDIAALAVTDSNIIVGDGANWVAESGATARTSLGLVIGTDVQAFGAVLDDFSTLGAAASDGQFIVATGAGVFAYESGATARASLGLVIGTNVQAWDAQLDDIAALAVTAGNIIVADGANWTVLVDGAAGQQLQTDGAGTLSWVASGASTVFSDSVFRIQDNGDATKELGFEVSAITTGTTRLWTVPDQALNFTPTTGDFQASDAGLTDIAGLAVTDSNIIVGDGANWVAESGATARTSLGVGIGTDVQGYPLSGDVVTSGTVATIQAKAVDIAMLADGTDGELITWSATGVAAVVATGSATQVLTSNGAGTAPTFQAAGASDLNGLTDVTITAAATDDMLVYTGAAWVDRTAAQVRAHLSLEVGTDVLAQQSIGISDNFLLEVDGTPNSAEYARFTASGLEGRTEAEFKADFNLEIATDVQGYPLAGDVVTSGTTATIQAKAVDVAMLADGTDGELITWDASGVAATVAVGSAGQALTSNGVGVAPTFQNQTGGNEFSDSLFRIQDNGDATKELAFEVSGISTGTTRTITVPNTSGTLPLLNTTQLWTGQNNFTDTLFVLQDNTDPTKFLGFELSSISTGTTWIITMADANVDLGNIAVSLLADGTDGELITWDSSGVAATVSVGTSTQVLTSNGVGAAPTFQNASAGALNDITDVTITAAATDDMLVYTGAAWVDRTAAQVRAHLSLEVGTDVLAEQAIGITDNDLLEVDGSPNAAEYARFTANGLEGRTEAEFKADFNLEIGTDVLAEQTIGITDNDLLEVDGSPNSAEYARFTAAGLEGRTEAEFKADFNLEIGTDVQAFDAQLSDFAGLGVTAGNIIYADGANWIALADGSAGEQLQTDGAGTLSWEAAGGTDFDDSTFRIQDNGDATKELAFEVSTITTGTTRTINIPDGDVTLSVGTMQIGPLTGDVTTSGAAATIAAKAVDVAMLADGTDGELITWDASGVAATVAVGTATHVLTSNGVGVAPTFQAAAGGDPNGYLYTDTVAVAPAGSGAGTLVIGDGATGDAFDDGVIIGNGADINGACGVAIGSVDSGTGVVCGTESVAIGGAISSNNGASADNADSVAIGTRSISSAAQGTAVGSRANVASSGVAIGYLATASGVGYAIAIGNNSDATASRAIGIGFDANATAANAVAIGQSVTNATANEVHIGVSNTIKFRMKSDGTLSVEDITDYETLVTGDDDIPNKKYVDDNVGASALTDLSDVTITAAATDDMLVYTGAAWVDRTAAQVRAHLSLEVGTDVLAEQAIGIADDNLLEVDGSPNSAEYARFTANGLEGRTEAEFKGDFNLEIGTDVLAEQAIGITDNDLLEVDGSPNSAEYARFTAAGLEGRTEAEFKADFNLETGTDIATAAQGALADSAMQDWVDDVSPQAGADVDMNAFDIQFDDATGIRDSSDNEQLIFQKTASAVNYAELTNAATGTDVTLAANGSDTDVGLTIGVRGAGKVTISDLEAPMEQNTQTGTTYTAVIADADKMITLSNAAAIAMTIPANSSVAYPIGTKLNFMALGAGAVTIGITTDTLNVSSALTKVLTGQYSVATAFKITATTWTLFGDLVAV